MRTPLIIGATTALLLGSAAALPTGAAAADTTITACVHKKSGKTYALLGSKASKKCKKGYKKVKWNVTGPQGTTGPQGAQGPAGPKKVVRDSTGRVMGEFLTLLPEGLAFFNILVDGGAWFYSSSGQLLSTGGPKYTDIACTSTPYDDATSTQELAFIQGGAGGQTRYVYRQMTPIVMPASAWKVSHQPPVAVPVAQPLYRRESDGTCQLHSGAFTGFLVQLDPVTSVPSDGIPPLTIASEPS